jgi:hypothetical protein
MSSHTIKRIIITQTTTTIQLRVIPIVIQVSQVLVLKIIQVAHTTMVAVRQFRPDQKVDSITTTVMVTRLMFLNDNQILRAAFQAALCFFKNIIS